MAQTRTGGSAEGFRTRRSPCAGKKSQQAMPSSSGSHSYSTCQKSSRASQVGHTSFCWALRCTADRARLCVLILPDADILSLLRILLKIPLSPQTPSATTPFFTVTSASKRTYAFSIYALTHLRLPNRILLPVANDIIEACRRATTLNFPTSSSKAGPVPGAESNSNIKAKVEGLGAIYNLLSRNSSIFLSYHKELMPILLRGLIDKTPSVRARASAALGAAIAGGRGWVAECEEALRAAVVLEGQKKGTGGGAVGKLEKERRKIERKKREDEVRKSRKVSEEDVALTVVNGLKKKVGSGKDEMRTVQAIVVQLKASLERESGESFRVYRVFVGLVDALVSFFPPARLSPMGGRHLGHLDHPARTKRGDAHHRPPRLHEREHRLRPTGRSCLRAAG